MVKKIGFIDVAPTGYSSDSIDMTPKHALIQYRFDDTTEDQLNHERQPNFQSIPTAPISHYLNKGRNYTSSPRSSRRSYDDSGGIDVYSENRC